MEAQGCGCLLANQESSKVDYPMNLRSVQLRRKVFFDFTDNSRCESAWSLSSDNGKEHVAIDSKPDLGDSVLSCATSRLCGKRAPTPRPSART